MKRFSIFLVAMLVAVSASAQLVTSSSSMTIKQPKAPKSDRTQWLIRYGFGITSQSMSDNISFANGRAYGDDASVRFGYNLDFGFNHKMGNKGAYWGMSWGLGNRGYKINESNFERSFMAHNIQYTPFTFGWKIQCGQSKVALDPHFSIFLACDYIGKTKIKSEESVWTGYSYYNYTYESDWSIWDDDDYMPFDMGFKVGFGIWFNDVLNIDMTYQRGLIPAYLWDWSDYGDGPLTNNFLISLGIGF